eukprot:1437496-Ditylum_brightwellii.AAC.1
MICLDIAKDSTRIDKIWKALIKLSHFGMSFQRGTCLVRTLPLSSLHRYHKDGTMIIAILVNEFSACMPAL